LQGAKMKKMFLLLSSVIIVVTLTACSGGDSANGAISKEANTSNSDSEYNTTDDTNLTLAGEDIISDILVEHGGDLSYMNYTTRVVTDQSSLENAMDELQKLAIEYDKNFDRWIDVLKTTNIDFEKDNIFIAKWDESCVPLYTEQRVLVNDNTQINIVLSSDSQTCETMLTSYFVIYRVSKDIETIKFATLECNFTINMTQP
jgi:hypothetical protein